MHSPLETRASLILRLRDAADLDAWDEFVTVYGPLVYGMARRQGLQAADADDLVQELFAATARSGSQWLEREERGRFRAWLLRIARNLAINFLTRQAYRSLAARDADAQLALDQIAASDSEVVNQFEMEYRRHVFRWAAERVQASVSPSTWQAFYLTHIENQPIEAVASQLGMSVGNIYICRSRVLSRLRETVKQFEE
ncbi:MAG: RNA polymerase sigma factor [Aureliella sp.]